MNFGKQESVFFFEKKNQKTFRAIILVSSFLGLIGAGPRKTDPDWPCQQAKVSELSLGSFWDGPAVNLSADWQADPDVAALVGAVTQRRMPIDIAAQRLNEFAHATRADTNRALLLAFVGIYNVLDHERSQVLDGLDRFGQRQKGLADGLRQDGEAVRVAQADTQRDETKLSELTQRLLWDQQVFETRRQSVRAACEVPTAIEQRLFSLAKTLRNLLQ